MIAKLTGAVSHKGTGFIVVSNGFVGYKVFGTSDLIMKTREGETVSLWTHLAVRENALDLYGFFIQEEVDFFEMLMTVSGIGPRSALAIMNLAPVKTLTRAIGAEDVGYLTKVSGIGKKSAAKIVVELKDKIRERYGESDATLSGSDGEALDALKALGYSTGEAREALHVLGARRQKDSEDPGNLNETIKDALRILSSAHLGGSSYSNPSPVPDTRKTKIEKPKHRA